MSRSRPTPPRARRAPAATVSASEFKATCLELMDRVARERTAIVVTKHGVPVAQLVPADDGGAPPDAFGLLAGTVLLPGGTTLEAALAGDPDDWPDDGEVFPPARGEAPGSKRARRG